MSDVRADVRSYYEEEARLGLRRLLKGRRVELRNEFLLLLEREGHRSVLDLGAGPGHDGQGFVEAGIRFIGVDIAHGNCLLAAEADITVVQGSIAAPPFRPQSFDAGWSMSTLMHVPEDQAVEALADMTTPLREGAPFVVGLWGGERRDVIDGSKIEGRQRLFSLRPLTRNRELLEACGSVEHTLTWNVGPDDWEYQVFRIRIRGRRAAGHDSGEEWPAR